MTTEELDKLYKLTRRLTYYGEINEHGMEDNPIKQLLREAYVAVIRLQKQVYDLERENVKLESKALSVKQFMISQEDFKNDRYA